MTTSSTIDTAGKSMAYAAGGAAVSTAVIQGVGAGITVANGQNMVDVKAADGVAAVINNMQVPPVK